MKTGFNYGLLFTLGGVATLVIGSKIVLWHARRAEQRAGVQPEDVTERLARAEAALREANEELASLRSELTPGR